jgi:hypothetical protein
MDPGAALKAFESFRLKLQTQPALPAPEKTIDAQAEPVPAAA